MRTFFMILSTEVGCSHRAPTTAERGGMHLIYTLYINSSFRVYISRDPLTAETTCCSASPLGTRGGDGRDDAGRRSAGARFGSAFTPHISATERTRRIIRYWPSPLLPARPSAVVHFLSGGCQLRSILSKICCSNRFGFGIISLHFPYLWPDPVAELPPLPLAPLLAADGGPGPGQRAAQRALHAAVAAGAAAGAECVHGLPRPHLLAVERAQLRAAGTRRRPQHRDAARGV